MSSTDPGLVSITRHSLFAFAKQAKACRGIFIGNGYTFAIIALHKPIGANEVSPFHSTVFISAMEGTIDICKANKPKRKALVVGHDSAAA